MSSSNASSRKSSETINWESSLEASFAIDCKRSDLERLQVTIELCDASKKDHPVLSPCVLKHFDDRPLDRLPELKSYELKSKEGVTVAMLQLEIVQLDPTEVARRCDLKAEQYKRSWKID